MQQESLVMQRILGLAGQPASPIWVSHLLQRVSENSVGFLIFLHNESISFLLSIKLHTFYLFLKIIHLFYNHLSIANIFRDVWWLEGSTKNTKHIIETLFNGLKFLQQLYFTPFQRCLNGLECIWISLNGWNGNGMHYGLICMISSFSGGIYFLLFYS